MIVGFGVVVVIWKMLVQKVLALVRALAVVAAAVMIMRRVMRMVEQHYSMVYVVDNQVVIWRGNVVM